MLSIVTRRGCEVVANKYIIPALPINTEDEAIIDAVVKKSAPKKSRRLVGQGELLDLLSECQILLAHMLDDGVIIQGWHSNDAHQLSNRILKLFKEIE